MPKNVSKSKQSTTVSRTNETTRLVRSFLFTIKILTWRQNVLPVPLVRKGIFTGFRPGSKSGLPDIMGIIPPGLFTDTRKCGGIALFIEVKTGKDQLRIEQIGFIKQAREAGAVVMVVKDFDDFLKQWKELIK